MSQYTIYGRPECPYCQRAMQLLDARNLSYTFINMTTEGISKEALSKKLGKPVMTVPQILDGDHYVGGCSDLEVYL